MACEHGNVHTCGVAFHLRGEHFIDTVLICSCPEALSLSLCSGSRSGFHPSNNLPSHSHTNHTHPHAPHAPRVINHTPLRDQKGWKGEGGRGEKEKGKSYGSYRGREREVHLYVVTTCRTTNYCSLPFSVSPPPSHWCQEFQEEPEWMAFGPSDRSEVIELVGFDEHEKGRDSKLSVCIC